MHGITIFSSLIFLMMFTAPTIAQTSRPSTRPADVANGWDGSWFAYDRPEVRSWTIEQTTPTAEQVNFYARPARMTDDNLVAPARAPRPRTVDGVDVVRLRFRDADGELVPVLLCTPA